MVESLWKILWQFLKKLKIELLYDPAIPLLGKYSKELKAGAGGKGGCYGQWGGEMKA